MALTAAEARLCANYARGYSGIGMKELWNKGFMGSNRYHPNGYTSTARTCMEKLKQHPEARRVGIASPQAALAVSRNVWVVGAWEASLLDLVQVLIGEGAYRTLEAAYQGKEWPTLQNTMENFLLGALHGGSLVVAAMLEAYADQEEVRERGVATGLAYDPEEED
jgi:hypothetical protein